MSVTVSGVPTVTTVDGAAFSIRHVRPGAGEGAATVTVLGTAYGFEWLPLSTLPTSPDLVEGTYTTRIGDAGEWSLSFPNVASSKGLWRDKFSEDGCREFVEIYRDHALEFVGVIERVEIDRGTVTISGGDGFGLLKRAYERDRTWWDAPSTVIDHYTRVPAPEVSEPWTDPNGTQADATDAGWTTPLNASSITIVRSGVLRFNNTGSALKTAHIDVGSISASDWTARALIYGGEDATIPQCWVFGMRVSADDTAFAVCRFGQRMGSLSGGNPYSETLTRVDGGSVLRVNVAAQTGNDNPRLPGSMEVRKRGGWVSYYWNGAMVGVARVDSAFSGGLRFFIGQEDNPGFPERHFWGPVSLSIESGFIRRSAERGAVRLPGDLPIGGLRGRYHNHADIQGKTSAERRASILNPTREHYAERLDASINYASSSTDIPVLPGAASSREWFSVRWTGAVYLPQAGGNVEFRVNGLDDGARLWVGRTGWGEHLVDDWADGGARVAGPATFTAGDENGWYPLRLEFYQGATAWGVQLQFRRATGWTDPGGTVIADDTWTTVPATSLSPLGCHEGRIQGQSHFQIIQDAAAQAGYELLMEPMSLESGEFPGRLVPRIRVGRDTDVLLEVEDEDGAEPIMQPAVTRDSSDQAVRFIGAGSGSADGKGSQTIAEVANLDAEALFELQAWSDAGDASLTQLLEARLNAELALRATPWTEVRGNPRAMERLADTWPLSGTLAAMRWRPGDGLRISVPEIGVIDDEPRRLTQVTRSFMAEGRTSTTVGFRQRPRSAAVALREIARARALGARSFQGQPVTLTSDVIEGGIAAGAWTGFAFVALLPQDQVVRAVLKVVQYTGTGTLSCEINGTDRTSALGGAWSTAPLEIDVTAYAAAASTTDNRLRARMQQTGGAAGAINLQLIVEVRR